jgi:hypothetical protein
MNDLVSLFRNFIYRDLAFIIGGSIVIVSTLHAFGISLHRFQDQPYTLFLLTVLAYVVGYAVQDLGALLPCRPTFTGYVLRPGRLSRFLYWRFTNSGWEPLTFARNQEEALQLAIRLNKPKAVPKPILRELERIRSLKVFSMSVGGCSVLSAVIWLGKGIFSPSGVVDWIAVGLLLIFGLALICLGWVKALQEMQFYEAVNSVLNGSERTPGSKL